MSENPVGQRLKFLMTELGLEVKGFSKALDVGESTIRNYYNRGSSPNAEFLEKLTNTFEHVNLSWLLSGRGAPFFPSTHENQNDSPFTTNNFFGGQIAGKMRGKASQQQHANSTPELNDATSKLAIAEKEIEHLRAQLESANALLAAERALVASKDDFITLLRASYNRPN